MNRLGGTFSVRPLVGNLDIISTMNLSVACIGFTLVDSLEYPMKHPLRLRQTNRHDLCFYRARAC
jgi:hypothetical protein